MKRVATPLALALALAGCANGGALDFATPPETRWRAITTEQDRDRLRNWRKAWEAALPEARAADAAALAAGGVLFEPDQAMSNAMPPQGDYRCRTFKLGAKRPGQRGFTALPVFTCRVGRDGDIPTLVKLDGVQRPMGRLYADTDARVVFLGTLELGDENVPLEYGLDARRDMIGYVERIGIARWRLVLPWPSFESQLDVIELVPN
jgi:hypothetical protein